MKNIVIKHHAACGERHFFSVFNIKDINFGVVMVFRLFYLVFAWNIMSQWQTMAAVLTLWCVLRCRTPLLQKTKARSPGCFSRLFPFAPELVILSRGKERALRSAVRESYLPPSTEARERRQGSGLSIWGTVPQMCLSFSLKSPSSYFTCSESWEIFQDLP